MEGQPGGAGVHVGLVHGEEVDVVEDGAGVVEILHRLSKANIQQHSPEPLLLKSSFTIQQNGLDLSQLFVISIFWPSKKPLVSILTMFSLAKWSKPISQENIILWNTSKLVKCV